MDQLISNIDYLDKEFILFLMNYHSNSLDAIMHWLSEKIVWIPLYAYIIYRLLRDTPKGWIHIIFLLLTVGCADQIASGFAKPFFERFRPCHDPEINQWLDLTHCGGKWGFFSSHAATSFAIAGYIFALSKKHGYPLILWASIVAFSRVYLCVHYLSDIVTGALVGFGLGYLWWYIKVKTIKVSTH